MFNLGFCYDHSRQSYLRKGDIPYMEKIFWILVTGFAGAFIAKKRKLNPFFWFFVCFMLGLVALIGFFLFPYLKKKAKKKESTKVEILPPLFSPETIWYYLDTEEKQIGPMSFCKLQEMNVKGFLNNSTYIWNETFNHWKQWKDVFPTPPPQ